MSEKIRALSILYREIICYKIDKITLKYLNEAADYFYKKIVENMDIINESTSYMTKEAKELTTQKLYIVNKYGSSKL